LNGGEIKQKREALGLSREGLAYKAQLSVRTVERIERGHTPRPNQTTLARIKSALAAEEAAAV